jgi:hypothetical protein
MATRNKFIYYVGLVLIIFSCSTSGSTPLSDNHKSENVTSDQKAALEDILRPLVPEGYSFEIRQDQHDPFRWHSSGAFSGITFYFESNEPITKTKLPEGKERHRSVYLTFMPENYIGVALSPDEDGAQALPVDMFPSKYLGKYQKLQVYACSEFGYSLPMEGKLSEDNLRKTIGIVWDETRCITPKTKKEIEKIVNSILPKDYTIEVGGGEPYHWTSSGTSIGITFYLSSKKKGTEQDKNPTTTILTIMPSMYNGKPLPMIETKGIYHVGTKKYDPEVQVKILSATYLGNWHGLKLYGSVNWGHPLPKQGVLGEETIIKAFKLSTLEKNQQQRNSIGDASQQR